MARNISITVIPTQIQNLRTTSVTQTTIALAWDVYPGATGYEIRRNGTLVQTWYSGTQTTYSNSGHTAGTSYTYTVRPVVGGSGVASAQASIVVVTQSAAQQFAGFTPTVTVSTAAALQSALASATAGAIIGVEPGLYTATSLPAPSDTVVVFKTTNSGTAGNPIRIVARYPAAFYYGQTSLYSQLASGRTAMQGNPTFGCQGQSYVEWIGFYVDEAISATTDNSGIGYLSGCTGSKISQCVIRGEFTPAAGALHSGVRVNGVASQSAVNEISQNRIFNISPNITDSNQSAIDLLAAGSIIIQNNEIWGSSCGIFHKRCRTVGGAPLLAGNMTVRNNYVHDVNGAAIRFDGTNDFGATTYRTSIFQNLIVNCGALPWTSLAVGQSTTTSETSNVIYQNNTVIGGGAGWGLVNGAYMATPGIKWHNNLYSGCGSAQSASVTLTEWLRLVGDLARLSSQHNVYHACPDFLYSENSTLNAVTLAAWQSTYGQDTSAPAAITSDPLFLGGAGVAAYKLQTGSPARTIGRDLLGISGTVGATIPAGCYITGTETIGVG